MKKGLVIGLVVLLIFVGGIWYNLWGREYPVEKIERLLYENQYEEVCESAEGLASFPSEESCDSAVKCVAREFTMLVRMGDIPEIAESMDKDNAEGVFSDYATGVLGMSYSELDALMAHCFEQNGFVSSSS